MLFYLSIQKRVDKLFECGCICFKLNKGNSNKSFDNKIQQTNTSKNGNRISNFQLFKANQEITLHWSIRMQQFCKNVLQLKNTISSFTLRTRLSSCNQVCLLKKTEIIRLFRFFGTEMLKFYISLFALPPPLSSLYRQQPNLFGLFILEMRGASHCLKDSLPCI